MLKESTSVRDGLESGHQTTSSGVRVEVLTWWLGSDIGKIPTRGLNHSYWCLNNDLDNYGSVRKRTSTIRALSTSLVFSSIVTFFGALVNSDWSKQKNTNQYAWLRDKMSPTQSNWEGPLVLLRVVMLLFRLQSGIYFRGDRRRSSKQFSSKV